jgi:hypothetical protein
MRTRPVYLYHSLPTFVGAVLAPTKKPSSIEQWERILQRRAQCKRELKRLDQETKRLVKKVLHHLAQTSRKLVPISGKQRGT